MRGLIQFVAAFALGLTALAHATESPQTFRDCPECPEVVRIPGGTFTMGSPATEANRDSDENQRAVKISSFAAGRYEVTFAQWDACVAAGGCDDSGSRAAGGDNEWGRGSRPVIGVSWDDAQAYARWLSQSTGQRYRLLSEAEWEYAARAGTNTAFSTGVSITTSQANFNNPLVGRTQPVGSYAANGFGLYDMHGNVWEWVQDCYADPYPGAPINGSAYELKSCLERVNRGGSWSIGPQGLRSAHRIRNLPTYRGGTVGFRVARTTD